VIDIEIMLLYYIFVV